MANCPDWLTLRGSQAAWVPAWCDLWCCSQQTNGPLAANREQIEAATANEVRLWEKGRGRKSTGEVKRERERERERQHRLKSKGVSEWRGERQKWWTSKGSWGRKWRDKRWNKDIRGRLWGQKTEQCCKAKLYRVSSVCVLSETQRGLH